VKGGGILRRPRLVLAAGFLLAVRGLGAQAAAVELSLSLQEAVLTALERNQSLRVQRLGPALRSTYLNEEQGSLDPVLSADAGQILAGSPPGLSAGSGAEAGLSLGFSTGTSLSASVSTGWTDPWSTGVDLEVTQALLAGGRPAANRARIEQARLDLFASRHELRGFTESLAAEVESAYWGHYLALRQRDIYRESLGLAERQLEEARARMQVGRIAASELAAPRAEVTSRREALREGEKRVQSTRQRLLLLVNPVDAGLDSPLRLLDTPEPPAGALDDPSAHVSLGLRQRPDLAQARLALERGELEVVRTRAGLLPRLDLFIRLGGTGYADSFGGSIVGIAGEPYASAGLSFQLPLGNRAAQARAERAVLSQTQAEEALRMLERSVEADIRNAWRAAEFAAAGIAASAELRLLQQEKLSAEVEKFRNGSSTTYLVAQAQRDLLAGQLAEAQSAVQHLLAMVTLYRLEGSLLERRGIVADQADGARAAGQR
jgi:outer membrane protein